MKFYLLLFLAVLSAHVSAQDPDEFPNQRQEIQAQKVAFITQKLELTPEEAQVFWPHYNAYEQLIEAQKQELKQVMRANRKPTDPPTTAELDSRMQKAFAAERKRVDIEEQYYAKFKEVLPIAKVAALYQAERDFKRELIRTLRDRQPR